MLGFLIKITVGVVFLGVILLFGWQLYLFQKVEPTEISAASSSNLPG
jgi:predicted negative regulator of RcsB-dependent stress response